MPLEHRWPTKYWYARIDVFGNSRLVPLRVNIPSKPPPRGELGDAEFEKYRFLAKDRLEVLLAKVKEAKTPGEAEGNIEDLIAEWNPKSKKNRPKVSKKLALSDLGQAWLDAPSKRKRDPKSSYVIQRLRLIEKFVDFVQERNSKRRFCYQVDFDDAEVFAKLIERTGIAPKTYGEQIKGLRSVFRNLKRRIGFHENPFSEIPIPEKNSVLREVFSVPQLQAIFTIAKEDAFSGPLAIAGACTSMRLGDCVNLKWEHIDREGSRISVVCRKTKGRGKTKGRAYIPLMGPLVELLEGLKPSTGFVFPRQQAVYKRRASDVSYRVNRFLDRVADSLEGTEDHFVRKIEREDGQRMASVLGFAAFRTTWVTLAAMAGVPESLITRVTGHSNVDMILQHYFNPSGEDIDLTIAMKMSSIFDQFCSHDPGKGGPVDGQGSKQRELVEVLESIDASNWKKKRERAIVLAKLLC